MTNDLIEREELREIIQVFKKQIAIQLANNVEPEFYQPLANMLGLHFRDSLKEVWPDNAHKSCLRIKNYLKNSVLLEYNFSTALSLFAIAITEELPYCENITSVLRQETALEQLIDQVVAALDGTIIDKDLRQIIRFLLQRRESSSVINYLTSNPKTIQSLLIKLRHNTAYKDIEVLNLKLYQLIKNEAEQQNKLYNISLNVSLFTSIGVGAAMAAISLYSFGIFSPAVILPLTFSGLKHFSGPIEKVSGAIVNKVDALVNSKNKRTLIFSNLPSEQKIRKEQEFTLDKSVVKEAEEIITNLNMTPLTQAEKSMPLRAQLNNKKTNTETFIIKAK